jgi:hypothetical protein
MSETTLKNIAPDANSFEANGHKYIIHPSLGIERFRHFERLQVIAGFGADYATLYKRVAGAYDQINKMRVGDASVQMNAILEGSKRPIEGRQHPLLLICTLFIAREGDDLTAWNEAEATERINDWAEAGYDVGDFFALVSKQARQFLQVFAPDSQNTLETARTQGNPESESLPNGSTN